MGAPASTPGQIPNYTPGVDYVGSLNLPPPHYCDYVKCIRLPESTSPSQNIPPFQQIYATLPEYTPSSQNIPPFSTIICDPPKIYPSVPEYRPYPPFQQLYATLPESTPPPSPRIYPPFQQLYATLPDSTPPSQNVPHFQCQLYETLPQSTPPSQNIPPFSITICDPPRIYSSLPEYTPIFNNYKIMRPPPPRICPSLLEYFSVLGASGRFSHNTKASRKGGIFSDWGLYSWNIAYSCRKVRRDIFWERRGHIVV